MIELFDRIFNCAHRGASGHAPENTLSALERAIKLGADMAEVDVQLTADDQLVLFHDDSLARTSTGRGLLRERTLSELQTLDAGAWFSPYYMGEKIPTLAEAFELVRGRLSLNIELKTNRANGVFLASLTRAIINGGFSDHCVVTSFDHELIDELVASHPNFATGYIVGREGFSTGVFRAASLFRAKVDLFSLEKTLITPAELEFAAAGGKAVHAWTTNTTEEMSRLLALGVGGVITNYPDRFPDDQLRPAG